AYSTGSPVDLTPGTSYTCRRVNGGQTVGELSWDSAAKILTVKGTIFIDGSAQVSAGSGAKYAGQATLLLSGTFTMKNSQLCAVVAANGGCDMAAGHWNPNSTLLVVVADGDDGSGRGIDVKGGSFQGALVANRSIESETSSQVQGPIVSVYRDVTG